MVSIGNCLGLIGKTVALAGGVWMLASLSAHAQAEQEEEWRTWTSQDGTEIEAYLQEIDDDEIVIVRRDGREFQVPISRFSAEDRAYVAEQRAAQVPGIQDFRETEFENVDLPARHEIDDVPHTRPSSGDPLEIAVVEMVLDYHEIAYGESLLTRLRGMEVRPGEPMSPGNLQTALRDLPVDVEIIRRPAGDRLDDEEWEVDLNAIRTALSWDLPVIFARDLELVTSTLVGVATGYTQRDINVLDPDGGRSPFRIDTRTMQETLDYALIVFPQPQDDDVEAPDEQPTETTPAPDREFMSRLSTAIRTAPEFGPEAMSTHLTEEGFRTEMRDVNREETSDQMGRTRSYARSTGVSFIESALEDGNLVVIPQEHNRDEIGFMLIYGAQEGEFLAVNFLPDRSFEREPFSPSDLARNWISREDRSYQLYLIEIQPGR